LKQQTTLHPENCLASLAVHQIAIKLAQGLPVPGMLWTQSQSFGEQAKRFSENYTKAGAKALNMPFHMSS
jgi:hypothetical protein